MKSQKLYEWYIESVLPKQGKQIGILTKQRITNNQTEKLKELAPKD